MSEKKLPKVLLTGFQPFADDPVNPSWQAVSALPEVIEGVSIERVELPVEWFTSLDALEAKIKEVQPDILLMVGMFGGMKHEHHRNWQRGRNPCKKDIEIMECG